MKVITWNTNSRTKEQTLNNQCLFLDNQFDIITLQEITLKSQDYFKNFFKDKHVLSSFDLVSDTSILTGKKKYGQLIILQTTHLILLVFDAIPRFHLQKIF